MNVKQENNWQISQGTLLAVAPFIGTYVSYLFESGYLLYFHIPTSLMQLGFVRIIEATAAITIFALTIITLIFAAGYLSKGDHPARRALLSPTLSVIFIGALGYLSQDLNTLALILLVAFLIFLSLRYIPPLFDKNSGNTYKERLSKDLEKENSENSKLTFKDAITLFLFGSFIIFALGLKQAKDKELYLTINGVKDKVVIEIYGDLIILKKYNPETKIIESGLNIIKISESTQIELLQKRVGPLISKPSEATGESTQ